MKSLIKISEELGLFVDSYKIAYHFILIFYNTLSLLLTALITCYYLVCLQPSHQCLSPEETEPADHKADHNNALELIRFSNLETAV